MEDIHLNSRDSDRCDASNGLDGKRCHLGLEEGEWVSDDSTSIAWVLGA